MLCSCLQHAQQVSGVGDEPQGNHAAKVHTNWGRCLHRCLLCGLCCSRCSHSLLLPLLLLRRLLLLCRCRAQRQQARQLLWQALLGGREGRQGVPHTAEMHRCRPEARARDDLGAQPCR